MTVHIYGTIGDSWWGESTTKEDVISSLSEEDGDEVIVAINSHGGNLWDGLAIKRILERHDAKIIVEVDGLAASAASIIAMGADEIRMPRSSFMMVHNARGISMGDHNDMRDAAEELEKINGGMVHVYGRSDVEEDELKQMLDDEEWLSADDAVALGFADVIIDDADEDEVAASLAAQFDLRAQSSEEMNINDFDKVPPKVAAMVMRGAKLATEKMRLVASTQQGADSMARKENDQGASSAPQDNQATNTQASDSGPVEDGLDHQSLIDQISKRCEGANVDTSDQLDIIKSVTAKASSDGLTTAQAMSCAQDMIIDALAQSSTVPEFRGSSLSVGETDDEKFREGCVAGIRMRASCIDIDAQNPWRGKNLQRVAEECVARTGNRPPNGRRELYAAAVNAGHFTAASSGSKSRSDFPLILEDVMRKELLRGWNRAPSVWTEIARSGSLSDFREKHLVSMNVFDNLREVEEGEEYVHGGIGERGATISLGKFGRLCAVTFEMMVDDDLDELTRIPFKMGQAASKMPERLAFDILINNADFNGENLFSAAHNNTTDDTFSHSTVKEMRERMWKQTIETKEGDEEEVDVNPSILVVPTSLLDDAQSLMSSEYIDTDLQRNTLQNAFDIVHARRLNRDSDSKFYILSDPQTTDVIEVAFLDGNAQPEFFQKEAWSVDQTEYKVRMVCGAAPYDFRGLQRGGA